MKIRSEFKEVHPEIAEALMKDEYAFLGTNKHLGNNVIYLCLGGSHAYGTNTESSDVDIRGVAVNTERELLGLSDFETYVETNTDTTVYSASKYIKLLMICNPNIIEMLCVDDSDIIYINPLGKMILDNKELFLSKKAYWSFAGYAGAQLKRLQNATARDTLPEELREKHIMHSIERQISHIYQKFEGSIGNVTLHIGDAIDPNHSKEILMNGSFKDYPLRAFNQLYNSMNQVCKDYDHLDNRNRKKDSSHLNKHAMHLIRLYMMCEEILSGKEVHTRRSGAELELLTRIRNGEFMKDDLFIPEFYELVDEYSAKLEEVRDNSLLPDQPDKNKIEDFLIKINHKALLEGVPEPRFL